MSSSVSKPLAAIREILLGLEAAPYGRYRSLIGSIFNSDAFTLKIIHIQGSPGAFPASLCRVDVDRRWLGLADETTDSASQQLADADFILRAFTQAVDENATPNRGSHGSGSFQCTRPGQQILARNIVYFSQDLVHIHFLISLPGSVNNRILGNVAAEMLGVELPQAIQCLRDKILEPGRLLRHRHCVEEFHCIHDQLKTRKLVAFIADGSLLPRDSGTTDLPLENSGTAFTSCAELAETIVTPNGGTLRGMGIPEGITAIIGGGFHGKSTLLSALARGVYPHIPGDGRELVITRNDAMLIASESGRVVRGIDISPFMDRLPGGADNRRFCTDNASGSTSQAASIIEAIHAGSRLLLIDEDSSAANLLNRDADMRRLIPDDPITPLLDPMAGAR